MMSKRASHLELKRLQSQYHNLQLECNAFKEQSSYISKQITQKNVEINKIEKAIEKLQVKDTIISEHAIIRYLERVYKLDIEKLKEEILPTPMRSLGELQANMLTLETHKVKIKDNVVVTVLER